jgi:hypothetical protein
MAIMPNPLVIFEHEYATGAQTFIKTYAKNLKKAGYKKVIWLVNFDITAEAFDRKIYDFLHYPTPNKPDYPTNLAIARMVTTLRKYGIEFEHMTPPRQNELNHLTDNIEQNHMNWQQQRKFTNHNQPEQALLQKKLNIIIGVQNASLVNTMIGHIQENQGGVIFMVGLKRHNLIQLLNQKTPDVRYAVFPHSSDEATFQTKFNVYGLSLWTDLYDAEKRQQYFQADVSLFDAATMPTYQTIRDTCQLVSNSSQQNTSSNASTSVHVPHSMFNNQNITPSTKTDSTQSSFIQSDNHEKSQPCTRSDGDEISSLPFTNSCRLF